MIISIASQKGGTGKTTTSISLSAGLASLGKKVLLVDMDSQANSSKVLFKDYASLTKENTIYRTILDKKPLPVIETSVRNLSLCPSHILLSNTDIELTTALDHREERLKSALDKIKHDYDYVIIDCPPALSWLTLNSFNASDEIMVVVSPGYFELDSIIQIKKTIRTVQDNFNQNVGLLGFLFTMSDPTVNSKTSLQLLRESHPKEVFKTVIPRNTDIRDAHMSKMDIFSYAPRSTSAQAYSKLIKEIFNGKKN